MDTSRPLYGLPYGETNVLSRKRGALRVPKPEGGPPKSEGGEMVCWRRTIDIGKPGVRTGVSSYDRPAQFEERVPFAVSPAWTGIGCEDLGWILKCPEQMWKRMRGKRDGQGGGILARFMDRRI